MCVAPHANSPLAQTPTMFFAVSGVAYDSLQRKPLAGATLHIVGRDVGVQTDRQGQFCFD